MSTLRRGIILKIGYYFEHSMKVISCLSANVLFTKPLVHLHYDVDEHTQSSNQLKEEMEEVKTRRMSTATRTSSPVSTFDNIMYQHRKIYP